MQLYVEEDCLDGYYGKWINTCSTFLTSDMEIFCTCIKIQFHFIKNEMALVKKMLLNLNELIKNHKTSIHPILLGRIAAWNFIIKNDGAYIEKYLSSSKDIYEKISILTFYYRLIHIYGTKNSSLNTIILQK